MTIDWDRVCTRLEDESASTTWCYGQDRALRAIAGRLRNQPGVLLADDVGLGKTRVALAVVQAVVAEGGTAAVLAPPGLLYQWEQEWSRYQPENPDRPAIIRTFDQSLRKAEDHWPLLAGKTTRAQGARWAILSHRFGLPSLRDNSRPERYGLPALALAYRHDARAERGFRNTSLWRFARDLARGCRDAACGIQGCWRCAMVTAARFLAKGPHATHLDRLDASRCIEPQAAKAHLAGDGRTAFLGLAGAMIGDLDLVVIDEAHKSRDDGEGRTVLGELSDHLLRIRGKRIALTATPVELGAEQWREVLRRAGVIDIPMKAITDFSEAHRLAQRHPDNAKGIEQLIITSAAFQAALSPHVIRRRRIAQPAMRDLVGEAAGAHPHREHRQVAVPYTSISTAWRPVVLALEGLGQAAKGSGAVGASLRTADLRYAGGHLADAALGDEADAVQHVGEDLSGKAKRIAYWRGIVRRQMTGDAMALAAHPRVAAVATHLDGLLHTPGNEDEKVLVFGVFIKPLRALVESLNRRAILRMLDQGLTFPMTDAPAHVRMLWAEYRTVRAHSDQGTAISGYRDRLQVALAGPAALEALMVQADLGYRRARATLQRSLGSSFLRELPGDAAIARLQADDQERLLELLRGRIANNRTSVPGSVADESAPIDRDSVRSQARKIWIDDFLAPCLDRDGELEEEDAPGDSTPWHGDANLSKLDRLGDAIDVSRLKHLIQEESGAGLGRFSTFARLLSGDTRMETRRALQAQFNRAGSMPRVLVAQSQVGREGLNLHTACRHVLSFNPEWNPAVTEQQIGRVDRIESRWEACAKAWRSGGSVEAMPTILVEHVVFEGTYDEHQWSVASARQRRLRAHLHGELLDEEALASVPTDLCARLHEAAPRFEP